MVYMLIHLDDFKKGLDPFRENYATDDSSEHGGFIQLSPVACLSRVEKHICDLFNEK